LSATARRTKAGRQSLPARPANASVVLGRESHRLRVARGSEVLYSLGMSLEKLDSWIGANLFVPLIVKFCQVTRQSQFAVSRLFWFLAALDGFYRAGNLLSALLFGGMSVVMMITASLRADSPTYSNRWFRLLAVLFLVLDIVKGVAAGAWVGVEFWVFVLIAEYAATIRTIPPREIKQGRPGVAQAREQA
jgi:hypothetical protein